MEISLTKMFITCYVAFALLLSGCGSDHDKNKSKKEPVVGSQGQSTKNSKSQDDSKKDEKDPRQQIRDQFAR